MRLLRARLERAPRCVAVRVRLAATLRETGGRDTESTALLRDALALAPRDPDVQFELGLQLIAQYRTAAGFRALRRASRRGHSEAQFALAKTLLGSKRRLEVLRGVALLRRVAARLREPGHARALSLQALFELAQRGPGRAGREGVRTQRLPRGPRRGHGSIAACPVARGRCRRGRGGGLVCAGGCPGRRRCPL